MNIEHFLKLNSTSWLDAATIDSDIVMSTRIRLARNIQKYRFPTRCTEEEANLVEQTILKAILSIGNNNLPFSFFPVKDLSVLQRQILVEKHLISPHLAKMESTGSVFLAEDETLSVMVNEEDHLRIQSLLSGLHVYEAYDQAMVLHHQLEKQLSFNYDEQFGYLTACPTNVGTGLRASVMLHLPALTMTKKMNNLIHTLTRLGMTVRGIYGEGSNNLGNIYQISNQVTLGKSDKEILDDLLEVVEQIVLKERLARKKLVERAPLVLEDRIFRALGTLKYARILTSEEAATCLSNVRFGVDMGIIKDISRTTLNECMLLIQPGFIQQLAGVTLQPVERDLHRAKLLQQHLLSNNELKNTIDKGEEPYDV